MAPPSIRRSGFSKRAQYNAFYGYLAGIVGAVLGAVFLIFSFVDPSAFSALRGLASDLAAPAGRVIAEGRDKGSDALSAIGGFAMSGSRKARLEKEAREARVRLAEMADLRAENRRLKALLDLPRDPVKPVATAQLIGSTGTSTRRFATISVGSGNGVAVGMPVRSAMGLVGRVLEVSRHGARVMLITDTESMVPVRRARDGLAAFAQGLGDGRLQLRLINLGINPLKPGDVFVTSGSGGLYHPGVAVGVVMQTTHDGAIARVLSDPSSSEFVVVEPTLADSVGLAPLTVASSIPPEKDAR